MADNRLTTAPRLNYLSMVAARRLSSTTVCTKAACISTRSVVILASRSNMRHNSYSDSAINRLSVTLHKEGCVQALLLCGRCGIIVFTRLFCLAHSLECHNDGVLFTRLLLVLHGTHRREKGTHPPQVVGSTEHNVDVFIVWTPVAIHLDHCSFYQRHSLVLHESTPTVGVTRSKK